MYVQQGMDKKTPLQRAKEKAAALSVARTKLNTKYDPALCDIVLKHAKNGNIPILSAASEFGTGIGQIKAWRKLWPDFGAACDAAEAIYCTTKMTQYVADMRKNKGNSAMWQHYAKSHIDRILYADDNIAQGLTVNIIKPRIDP